MDRSKALLWIFLPTFGCADASEGRPTTFVARDTLPVADASTRVGVYYWGADDQAFPGFGSRLDWGRGLVTDLGAQTMRVAMTPADPYRLGLQPTDSLTDIARHPAYASLFADPRLSTIMITAYTAADQASTWVDGYDPYERDLETQEIAELGAHLLQTYPDKTFIVLNWEGDNALRYAGGGTTAFEGFRAWTEARIAGVKEARAQVGGGHLYAGLEFDRVFDCDDGSPTPCVLTDIAPRVDADVYSFSSYEALAVPPAQLSGSMTAALDLAYDTLQRGQPALQRSQVILGEFGFPREAPGYGDCSTAERVATTIAAAIDWGVSYAIFWQLADNARRPGEAFFGFGAHRPDGSLTLAGEALVDFFDDGRIDAVQSTGCPELAAGGVVDAFDYDASVAAGGYVAIFGSNLDRGSAEDTVVHFAHEDVHVEVDARSPYFFVSDGQVNAEVPNAFERGQAVLVWITTGAGLDSGGGFVTIE
jgi:hypothetical protein